MLVKLPESAPDRKRSFGGTALSTLIHALLIGSTVVGTGFTVQQASEPQQPPDIIYVPVRESKPEVPPPETRQQEIATDLKTPPPDLHTVIDLGVIPDVLPPPNTIIGTMHVDEVRVARRDSVPVGPAIPASNEPFTELMVEQVVRPRSGNPAPRYPSMLASAGVEGVVYARFVVDTTGRVEGESITIQKSDHQLFERAVREVLLRSRFIPAQVGSHPVRQLVEQAFSFSLKR